jgi:predicted transcriptional regulator
VVKRVKTTVEIPEEVWKAAKVLAVEERRSFQEVVTAALEEYLQRRKKGGKK